MLRWAGAAYIVWLGLRLLLSSSATVTADNIEVLRPFAAREGMIANLSNPWPLMFMVAFLPQFVEPNRGSVTFQLVLLGATQKITGVLVLGTYALASGAIGAWIIRHPRQKLWQQRLAGCFIIGLGVRMVIGGGTTH
nr:LysE family translocator [Mesorhizobium sp. dw_380]